MQEAMSALAIGLKAQIERKVKSKFHADTLMLVSLEQNVELPGLAQHLIKLSISQPYTFASLEMSEINMILKQAVKIADREDQIAIHRKLSESVLQYD